MKVRRKSPFTGLWYTREIGVTREQLEEWWAGELIQRAMPQLTASEREFIMTGIPPHEWDESFGEPVTERWEPDEDQRPGKKEEP